MDVVTGEVIHELSRLSVPGNTESDYFAQATAMSEDRIFVGAPGGNYIAVFNRETGAYIERIENNDTASGFGSHIQVDQENNILITRSDSDVCVHVLDLTTYENIYVVNAGGGSTSSSVFVYDGLLYVGVPQNYGGDGYVNVYDYQAQQLVTTITSPNPHWAMENFGISISASGRTLFVLDGYRPYDDGVQPRKYEHGAIFGLSLDNDYEETIFWQDYNWQPIGDHIKVFGDKMILGSPAYLDDDGDIVAGKVRIFKLNSLT
jgi:outer membrane protein assembly factor BamB